MSDETDLEKQLLASSKRFEIYVPKPKARMSLGTTATKQDPDGPWGHAGITMAADDNVVTSAAKSMVIQSGSNTNFVVGGALGQYTQGDVNLTSGADMRLAAAQRLLIMSGANNDPSTQALTGDSLRLQSYNHLAQHYRVDAFNVGLFEFFHGRRKRPLKEPSALRKTFSSKSTNRHTGAKEWSKRLSKFNHEKTTDPLTKDAELRGGFAENALRTLNALYPAERDTGDLGTLFYPVNKAYYPKNRKKAAAMIRIPPKAHPPFGTNLAPVPKIKESERPSVLDRRPLRKRSGRSRDEKGASVHRFRYQ